MTTSAPAPSRPSAAWPTSWPRRARPKPVANKVLMVAFHFPPQRGSSGIQRTLKFAQYLPAHGWQPLVLSAHPRAYADAGGGPYAGPAEVTRAFALDSARHLAF